MLIYYNFVSENIFKLLFISTNVFGHKIKLIETDKGKNCFLQRIIKKYKCISIKSHLST